MIEIGIGVYFDYSNTLFESLGSAMGCQSSPFDERAALIE
jgi:hypothetical protein